jgi:hypothetical protein
MRRGAGAAPPRPHYVGLATLVLSGLCLLGIATSPAVAGLSPLEVPAEPPITIAATPPPPPPDPDPKPAAKPDPKPAPPKQPARQAPPPPPPPPPPVEPTEPRATPTTALPPTTSPKTRAKPAVRSKPPPRKAAATVPRPRPLGTLRRAPIRPALVAWMTPIDQVRRTLAPDLAPAPFVALSEPSRPITSPAILPLLGLGLLLLLGASVASARWVPWPELAVPLYAHRRDLATVGVGVIALAFLWLNAAVLL